MNIIGWIRKGDQAACGATVAEGLDHCISYGRPLAFKGARIGCRRGCVIAEGFERATLPNGRARVIHGMVTTRGCPLMSSLNGIDGVGNEGGAAVPQTFKPGPGAEWTPVYAPAENDQAEYDQHLVIEDQDGRPLEGVPCSLMDARGEVVACVTDADGKTARVAGRCGDTLDCEIGKELAS